MKLFLVNHLLLLTIFSRISFKTNAESDICETHYYIDYQTILCTQYSRQNPPNSDNRVLRDSCDEKKTKTFYGSRENSLNLRNLNNMLCSLKPQYFDFLNTLNIESFTSNSNNTILRNDTFHGLCKLKSIDLSKNEIKVIDTGTFSCLTEITELYLSNNLIDILHPDVFRGMNKLQKLLLNGNLLFTVISGTFDPLVSLEELELQDNSISYLPSDIFHKQLHLRYLDLYRNSLENVNQPILTKLPRLKELILTRNKLIYLSLAFALNQKLKILFLDKNLGLSLSNSSFIGLTNLAELHMSGCDIHVLPLGLFQETVKLLVIRMEENKLKIVPPDVFRNVKNLIEIDLSSNDIKEIKDQPFRYNRRLKSIDLSENRLTELKSGDFQGLYSLEVLDVSDNIIEQISENSFNDLMTLSLLMLQNNLISSLLVNNSLQSSESIFQNLVNMKTLFLSNNTIKNFTNAFSNNHRLLKLHLDENLFLELDNDSFIGLYDLTELYIDNCNIEYLPERIFTHMPNLSILHIYNNSLNEITSKTLGALKNVREIDFSFNGIFELKDQPFKQNEFLERIDLSNNNFSEIKSDYFQGLKKITELNLSWNFIRNISVGSFKDLNNLEYLNIKQNLIENLPVHSLFKYNNRLKTIDVSYNYLNDLKNVKLGELHSLEEFRASHNKMKELLISRDIINAKGIRIRLESNYIRRINIDLNDDKGMNITRYNKTQIYLKQNLLECDCNAYSIYELLNKSNVLSYIQFTDGFICKFPQKHEGKEIIRLKHTDFICNIVNFCPENCSCIYTAHDNVQSLNCNNQDYQNLPPEAPLNTGILYIRKNRLKSLKYLKESLWKNLTEIYADDNAISDEEFYVPRMLKFLSLKGNNLKAMPVTVKEHAELNGDFQVTLSNNSWPCDCSILTFKSWLLQYQNQVTDNDDVRCIFPNESMSTIRLTLMDSSELCPSLYVLAYSISFMLALLFTSIFVFYYKFKLHILSFFYTHCNGLYTVICCDRQSDENKLFDCFIAYSSDDRDITLAILKELEEKPPHYNICIHERNWMPGKYISNNILLSVQSSRKTLIVLSKKFIKSDWFYMEFQAAYRQTLQDRKDRLIIILKGDMPDMAELDDDVRYVISWKSYLIWGEKWFWEKLRYAIHEDKFFKRNSSLRRFLNCFKNENTKTQEDISL